MYKYAAFILGVMISFVACDLERDVNIDLPEYESEIVVESYIEPGQPLRALLTESLSYTELPTPQPIADTTLVTIADEAGDSFTLPLAQLELIVAGDTSLQELVEDFVSAVELLGFAQGANVVVNHNGNSYVLEEGIYFDLATEKVYNYGNPYIVPADYGSDFSIEVNASKDRNVFASATLLAPVPIDSTVLTFNDTDTIAAAIVWFTDDPGISNFYRFTIGKQNRRRRDDFAVNDRFFDGDDVPFGTGFEYKLEDTLVATLYHIEESYHDFLETFEEAEQANGNPFGQPASIISNVEGGLGIFATLSYDRQIVPVE